MTNSVALKERFFCLDINFLVVRENNFLFLKKKFALVLSWEKLAISPGELKYLRNVLDLFQKYSIDGNRRLFF